MKTETTRGFTLVELLLVIAVIGLLAGMLFNGVFGVTKQANRKRNENNRKLLHAAIMEYRHDTGKWPIPPGDLDDAKPAIHEHEIKGTKNKRKVVSTVLDYGSFNNDGTLSGSNNDVIVERLLNGVVGTTKTPKRYLDLRTFITTEAGTETAYLTEATTETMSAYDAWRNGSDARREGKNLPLVYRDSFIRCPVCGTINFSDAESCRNDHCEDPETEDKSAHPFTKAEKSNSFKGALPYKVTFDLANKTCTVSGLDN